MFFQLIKMNRKMFIRGVVLPALIIALVAAGNAALASSQDAAQFVDRLGKQTIEALRAPEPRAISDQVEPRGFKLIG